jgi:hypothetical protein
MTDRPTRQIEKGILTNKESDLAYVGADSPSPEGAEPRTDLRTWMQEIVASGRVAPPVVAGHEWPARCWDCGFTTEDPDAYAGDDEELMPPEHLCIETGTFHRWVPAGTVRYLPADFLEAIEREAALPEPSPEGAEPRTESGRRLYLMGPDYGTGNSAEILEGLGDDQDPAA